MIAQISASFILRFLEIYPPQLLGLLVLLGFFAVAVVRFADYLYYKRPRAWISATLAAVAAVVILSATVGAGFLAVHWFRLAVIEARIYDDLTHPADPPPTEPAAVQAEDK